jgi:hypothetical protein
MADVLEAKEARENAKAFMEQTASVTVGNFFEWVTQESNQGSFSGTLPRKDYKFTAKEMNYLRKMGYKILPDKNDVDNWRVDW